MKDYIDTTKKKTSTVSTMFDTQTNVDLMTLFFRRWYGERPECPHCNQRFSYDTLMEMKKSSKDGHTLLLKCMSCMQSHVFIRGDGKPRRGKTPFPRPKDAYDLPTSMIDWDPIGLSEPSEGE